MKIIIFDINRLSFGGGAEKYLSEVGITFSKKGDEVYFVGDCRPIMKLFIWSSVFLFINPFWKLPKLFSQLNESLPLSLYASNFITHISLKLLSLVPFSSERKNLKNRLEQADAIFIKNEIAEVFFFWLLNIQNKYKYLVIFSSIEYPFPDSFRAKIHNMAYLSKVYKFFVNKIGKVIVSNKEDEKYFIETVKIDKNNVFYIPYGLEESYFAKPKELKKTLGFKVLFVGRMEEQKGIIHLNQIIENINNDDKKRSISFCLVGSGPLESIPICLAETYKNVEYKGQLSLSDVRKCYLESDLVIITSKWETFSYVCLEAQACGVPVISFDIPGPREMIEERSTGRLIPPWDIKKFCSSIFDYYFLKEKNIEEYLELRRKIAGKFKLEYSINKTAAKLKNIARKGSA